MGLPGFIPLFFVINTIGEGEQQTIGGDFTVAKTKGFRSCPNGCNWNLLKSPSHSTHYYNGNTRN
jgi:hypothetical protein